jgi:hypothetical protein
LAHFDLLWGLKMLPSARESAARDGSLIALAAVGRAASKHCHTDLPKIGVSQIFVIYNQPHKSQMTGTPQAGGNCFFVTTFPADRLVIASNSSGNTG